MEGKNVKFRTFANYDSPPPSPYFDIKNIFQRRRNTTQSIYICLFSVIKLGRRIEISFLRKYPENKDCGDM